MKTGISILSNIDGKKAGWPELVKNERYTILKEFYYNGEFHYKVKKNGKENSFSAPTCFFD